MATTPGVCGSSSWFEATPQLFNDAANAGYLPTTPQDFVDAYGANAPMAHIEDGAWIFPKAATVLLTS